MRELTFIGPLSGSSIGAGRLDSGDTRKLLLIAEDGTEFQLKVDKRLVAVVTREFESVNGSSSGSTESANGQPSAAQGAAETSLRPSVAGAQPISPREVQDRVRAGDTAEEIAEETGADLTYVERFASQVEAEIEQVIAAAATCEVMHEGKRQSFEQAATARLRILGVKATDVEWHALKAGHEWSVVLSYDTSKESAEAWFDYSLARKVITPANEEAQWLLAQPHNQAEEEPESIITPPVTTRATIQTPASGTASGSKEAQSAPQSESQETPANQATNHESSDQWDAEHPAAKALKRREAAQAGQPAQAQPTQPQATAAPQPVVPAQQPQAQNAQAEVDLRDETDSEEVIDQRDTMDETAQTSPEWEDLLFGTPSNDGYDA